MKRKAIIKQGLLFGGLAGLACILFFIGLYLTVPHPLLKRRPDIGLSAIMIWAGMWYFKRFQGGFLHFYEGISIGFLINIIGALITGLFLYFFVTYIDATVFTDWITQSKAVLIKDKDNFVKIMNEDNFKRQLISLENSKPYNLILDELMFKQLAIIPITLLTLILRKIS